MRLHLRLLALTLAALGLGLCYYKVTALGLPLQPAEETEVWTVEARIAFAAEGGPAQVRFYIPDRPPGFTVLGENFVSGSYGLATDTGAGNREARWSVRRASGRQVLYYRVQLADGDAPAEGRNDPIPPYPEVPDYPEPFRAAVMSVLQSVRAQSADIATFTRQLLIQFNAAAPDKDMRLLREGVGQGVEYVERLKHILAGARIPARTTYILRLQDGMRQGVLEPWLEVHNGREWLAFDPASGTPGYPPNALLWRVGDDALVSVTGGGAPDVEFAAARSLREVLGVAEERARLLESRVMEFSLFSLPIGTQNLYRVLLLVPVGAFLVVVLRNVIGIKTFGTFMPVLIALAFRETELLWGLFYFTLLVALALALRFYLETLKLLLVPRLAAVLIIVILLMAGTSLISHKLGLVHGVAIALFPMVILAMTVERMSLVWEEHGAAEALQQGCGSLIVAVIGYLAMANKQVAHLAFVFPELLLVVLAATLLLGRYKGYRLTELWRFRALLRGSL